MGGTQQQRSQERTTPMRPPRGYRRHSRIRGISITAVLATGALVLTACGSSLPGGNDSADSGASDRAVKIGLLVPTSGVYASLGKDMTQGFQLYLDEHENKLGGFDVDLVKADEGEGPDTGVPAATRLVQQNSVSAIVGVVNSAVALGLKDLVTEAKVPLLIANAGANDLTGPGASPYIWRTSYANAQPDYALGKYVADQLAGSGGVYLLGADYAAGKEHLAGFKAAFEAAGGEVLGEQYTPFGTTKDFQPYLSTAQASGAKAVFAFYAGAEAVSFVKQYTAFGLSDSMQLYSAGFLTEGGVLEAQGADALGVMTSLQYSDTLDNAVNKDFVAAYTKAFSGVPTGYAVGAYDAAAVLDKVLKTVGSTDGTKIADGIKEVGDIDSPRGTWNFDEGHNPIQSFYLRKVEQSGDGFANVIVEELGRFDQATATGRG